MLPQKKKTAGLFNGGIMKRDHNTIIVHGPHAVVPIRITSDTPQFSEDFSDTAASVKLVAHVKLAALGKGFADGDKLQLLLGSNEMGSYTEGSVMGKLVARLSRRFGTAIDVRVARDGDDGQSPASSGDVGYRLSLHPIPEDVTAAQFTGAVRQSLRDIARQMEPRSGRMIG
jgi:hypothetical protein